MVLSLHLVLILAGTSSEIGIAMPSSTTKVQKAKQLAEQARFIAVNASSRQDLDLVDRLLVTAKDLLDDALGVGPDLPPPPAYHMQAPKAPKLGVEYYVPDAKKPKKAPLPKSELISALEKAAKLIGVPEEWANSSHLLELVHKESSGNPYAKNPNSTAFGLFQLLESTWKMFMPGVDHNTTDPVLQAAGGMKYIKKTYKTPERALAFWNATKEKNPELAPEDLRGKAKIWVTRNLVGY